MNTPMTTKESEVDVLAVMDEHIADCEYEMRNAQTAKYETICKKSLEQAKQARAAVAEVFEEAKNALDGLELSGLSFAATRLRAALRNAGVKV